MAREQLEHHRGSGISRRKFLTLSALAAAAELGVAGCRRWGVEPSTPSVAESDKRAGTPTPNIKKTVDAVVEETVVAGEMFAEQTRVFSQATGVVEREKEVSKRETRVIKNEQLLDKEKAQATQDDISAKETQQAEKTQWIFAEATEVKGALEECGSGCATRVSELEDVIDQLKQMTGTPVPNETATTTPVAARILVVEDNSGLNPEFRENLVGYLEENLPERFEVRGVAVCDISGGPYVAAIMDYTLDGKAVGADCIGDLLKKNPGLVVVGHSMNPSDKEPMRIASEEDPSQKAGTFAFVLKPDNEKVLMQLKYSLKVNCEE